MSANLIRWERANDVAELGFAGSHEPWLFQIWTGGEQRRWQLITATTLGVDERPESADPDELKQQAETWLREFASSLGAVFPDGLRGAPPLPGFVPAAALRSELDLLASQHQALGDAKHGQQEALEHLGRAAAFDQVKEIVNSLEATR